MITPDFAVRMTRYNRWQNRSLMSAAADMTDRARWKDRGAVFGSVAQTLNHILWDDRVWMARFQGDRVAERAISARHPYIGGPVEWSEFVRDRRTLDDQIVAWAGGLIDADLLRPVLWTRGSAEVETPLGFNLVHMINHQTHHRGQVHAMLTAAGHMPGPTDLQMLDLLEIE